MRECPRYPPLEFCTKHPVRLSFLDLMSSSPGSFLVPTLDIDLAWHTHQMMGGTYLSFSAKHLKYLVDQ